MATSTDIRMDSRGPGVASPYAPTPTASAARQPVPADWQLSTDGGYVNVNEGRTINPTPPPPPGNIVPTSGASLATTPIGQGTGGTALTYNTGTYDADGNPVYGAQQQDIFPYHALLSTANRPYQPGPNYDATYGTALNSLAGTAETAGALTDESAARGGALQTTAAQQLGGYNTLSGQIVGQQGALADQANTRAGGFYSQYGSQVSPVEGKYYNEVQNYDSPAEVERRVAEATGDVNTAFDRSKSMSSQNLARYGINPAGGAFADMEKSRELGRASGVSDAANKARVQTRLEGINLRGQAIDRGRGLVTMGNQQSTLGQQATAGQANLAGTNAQLNQAAADAGTKANIGYLGAATSAGGALGNVGSSYYGNYSNAVAREAAAREAAQTGESTRNIEESNAIGSTVGSAVGAIIGMFSSKKLKTNRRRMSDEGALSHVTKRAPRTYSAGALA